MKPLISAVFSGLSAVYLCFKENPGQEGVPLTLSLVTPILTCCTACG